MSMTQTQEHNVPTLRFPEFSGEWFPKTFGDFVVKVKESHNPLKSTNDWPCIELESLGQGNGQILQTFRAKDLQSIKTKFQSGDVLFGKLRPYLKKYALVDFKGVCTSEIWVLRASDISGSFLYYIVQSPKFNQYANIQSGSKMPRSDWNIVSSITYSLPCDETEQQKIASFMSSVEGKIEQLGKKKALLEQYKKGMMQKLFSQELRFKDAQGNDFPDWEGKRLEDVADTTTGSSNREDSTEVGEYAFFDRSTDQRASSRYLFDCEAIIVAGEGKDFPPQYFVGKFDLHQRAYATMNFGDNIGKYLFYWIHFHRYYFLKYSVGSTMPSLRMASFSNFPVRVPTSKEQKKIADFLSSIDQKIDHVSIELEHAKTFKKGLLQQMFI